MNKQLMEFFRNEKNGLINDKQLEKILDDILYSLENKSDRAWDMRHAILHMAFPDNYEPIISTKHKEQIADTFKERISKEDRDKDIEEQLFQIRQSFEEDYPDTYFNFYLPEIFKQWKETKPGKKQQDGPEKDKTDNEENDTEDPVEEDPQLDELFSLLWRQKQIIL
ncbi:hypothetical protein [Natranaerofaba carboxydovora]|uniref:hypothetical protein n=1 Tax=Natranaerofaba carboxydovora TaxID=2742683 RepID=UPI001F1484C6|nr:hypothetical protein [Natranaerofaba carboxydovora]UMZ73726.1 hypothetical protein ACONDI_01292 [Natranaerofaba carboxydovora]